MGKILVTGGTVFVSRYVAEYFAKRGDQIFVLNRGSRPQSHGVTLIQGDRGNLGTVLKKYSFDAVLDVTSYTGADVEHLLDALGDFGAYILVSSSAVYPETLPQPFTEEQPGGPNSIWKAYGVNKLAAEEVLTRRVPGAYILRPPYLYGPMQNLYREPFVFECAEQKRPFALPGEGKMKLQFFHVEDLCRFIQILLEKRPENRIFNVGNPETVSVLRWVQLCYKVVGAPLKTIHMGPEHPQRSYFCFYDYEYTLDVTRQTALMPETKPLLQGLQESYAWFRDHREAVVRKPYEEYLSRL